jgi:GWxTD domain-containing protein
MRFHRIVFCLFVSAAASLCTAQTPPTAAPPDSLLKVAYRYLSRGRTDSARVLFEHTLSVRPGDARALLGLVQVAIEEEEWSTASGLCNDLLKQDPRNLAAHYYAGIALRELEPQSAAHTMDWARARKHFEAVIAADSLYKDVLFQFARLKEYEGNWPETFSLAERQIRARPDDVETHLEMFHLYKHFIAETDSDDTLPWLRSQANDYARYFIAEVLRRNQAFTEAETAIVRLLSRPSTIPAQACYLSLARIYASRHEDSRAEAAYWKAVDGIADWLGAALLFDDLKYIIYDRELDQYRSVASDNRKRAFFHGFWDVRNPMPAAPINARLIDHFRRYVRAEEDFEYYGFRGGFTNPDRTHVFRQPKSYFLNKEFNDMGLILLRQGPPDEIERTMGGFGDTNPLEEIDPNQSWIYHGSAGESSRVFHFARHRAASNNWRLVPVPNDPAMLEKLVVWDLRYRDLQRGTKSEQMRRSADLEIEQKDVVTAALTTDRHVWEKTVTQFNVPHGIDAFRNEDGRTLLDVSYAIPLESLREAAKDGTTNILVEVGISTSAPNGQRLGSRVDTLRLQLDPEFSGSYIGLFRQLVIPDTMHLAAHIRALNVPAVGTWSERVRVPSFKGNEFMLSDLQLLLPSFRGPAIEIDGVKVVQSPFGSYSRAKPLLTYLQVYNLVKDMNGKAAYAIRYAMIPDGHPEDATVITETKRDLTDDHRSEFQTLDIKGIKPGIYTLTVTVTDRKRVQTLTRSRQIEITR